MAAYRELVHVGVHEGGAGGEGLVAGPPLHVPSRLGWITASSAVSAVSCLWAVALAVGGPLASPAAAAGGRRRAQGAVRGGGTLRLHAATTQHTPHRVHAHEQHAGMQPRLCRGSI